MLSHLNRFHGHGSLRYVYRHGETVRGRSFAVKYIANKQRVHSRFAIVVSKKIYKSAVKRNRIRRRIYVILREHKELIHSPHDIVITVLDPMVLVMSREDIAEQLTSLLEKQSLLR